MNWLGSGNCNGWLGVVHRRTYHEAQVTPLVQKVAVDVDAVGFAQVFGDEFADGREVGGLFFGAVGDIAESLGGRACGVAHRGLLLTG